jgi:PST family polysaccharide transporter
MAFVISPLVISAYLIGLRGGPRGVALAYSIAMGLWLLPGIAWSIHGTPVRGSDLVRTAKRPFLAGMASAVVAVGFQNLRPAMPQYCALFLGSIVLVAVYVMVLLFVLGQKDFYLDIVRTLGRREREG